MCQAPFSKLTCFSSRYGRQTSNDCSPPCTLCNTALVLRPISRAKSVTGHR